MRCYLKLIIVLIAGGILVGCAAPREAARTYLLNVYANCYAEDCKIDQKITIYVAAEVKKEQKAEATQKTALDLTGIP